MFGPREILNGHDLVEEVRHVFVELVHDLLCAVLTRAAEEAVRMCAVEVKEDIAVSRPNCRRLGGAAFRSRIAEAHWFLDSSIKPRRARP